MVASWMPCNGCSVYNAAVGIGFLNAMLVDCDGMGLNANDAKLFCAAWQEFVVFAGGELVCILIFGWDKWSSKKKNPFLWFANWNLANAAVIVLFVLQWRLSYKRVCSFS